MYVANHRQIYIYIYIYIVSKLILYLYLKSLEPLNLIEFVGSIFRTRFSGENEEKHCFPLTKKTLFWHAVINLSILFILNIPATKQQDQEIAHITFLMGDLRWKCQIESDRKYGVGLAASTRFLNESSPTSPFQFAQLEDVFSHLPRGKHLQVRTQSRSQMPLSANRG